MSDETPTPRTDAALIPDEVTWMEGIVTADFARKLERELAQAQARCAELEAGHKLLSAQVIEWSQIASEDKKDAARYRCLRESDCRDGVPFIAIFDGRLSQWSGMFADEQ